MRTLARDWLLSVIAVVLVAAVFALGWSYILSQRPFVRYNDVNYVEPQQAAPGEFVNVRREMLFLRDADIVLGRKFVRHTDEGITDEITYASTRVVRKPGILKICRPIRIPPEAIPGDWEIQTTMTVFDWPFWKTTYDAPPVYVRVVNEH